MLKLFRKNQRFVSIAMAGFMILLLVSWLLTDSSTNIVDNLRMNTTTWAVSDGESISASELNDTIAEMRVLEGLGDRTIAGMGVLKEPGYWYLLVKEAKASGLIPPQQETLRQLSMTQMPDGVTPEGFVATLASRAQTSQETVLTTLAKLTGVQRLIALVASSGRISDERLRRAAAEMTMTMDGDVLILDAGKIAGIDAPVPDAAALEAQLKAHGNTEKGQGEKGFGYRLPNQLKLEWIVIPAATIKAKLEQSPALSNVELRKYWIEHEAEFRAKEAISATPMTFDSQRDAVREKVLGQLLDAELASISKFATDRVQMDLRSVPSAGGYWTLPADWSSKAVTMAALGQELAQRFGIDAPAVQTSGEGWIEVADIAAIPGIGTASSKRVGASDVKVQQLATALKEFGGSPTLPTQRGVAFPTLADPTSRDLFVVRVTEAQPARAATAVDEVRADLEADLKRVAVYDILATRLEALRQTAATEGLGAVGVAYGAVSQPFQALSEVNTQFLQFGMRMGMAIPGLGNDETAMSALVKAAMALPTDKPVADAPALDRTVVVALPDRLAVMVAQLRGIDRMDRAEYETLAMGGRLRGIAMQDEVKDMQELFSYAALKRRHNFTTMAEVVAEPAVADPGTLGTTEGLGTGGSK
ncbi:MAG: hypothetical protein KGR22_08255 [Planctomycetes bacterium]|nr:hypothetical protein [Planctomycetota bacterium]